MHPSQFTASFIVKQSSLEKDHYANWRTEHRRNTSLELGRLFIQSIMISDDDDAMNCCSAYLYNRYADEDRLIGKTLIELVHQVKGEAKGR